MNIRTAPGTLLLTGLMVLAAENAFAQNRTGFGSAQQNQQGGFGVGAQGGRLSAVGQAGQSLGQQGLSQAGRTGTGRTGTGRSGASPFDPSGNQGRQGNNVGRPPVGGQDGFVGSDADQIRNNRDPRQSRRAMFDFAIDSLNEMRESRRRERSRQKKQPPVRVQLRPLFTSVQPSATELTAKVRNQLSRALPTNVAANTRISVSGSTARIEGTVGSDYDRRLAAKMISIQPGISQVDNRLTIEPVPAAR